MEDFWFISQVVHIAACCFMAGLIAITQFIHYPAFAMIDRKKFVEFHKRHSKALGSIAGPVMLVELVTAVHIATSLDWFMLVNLCAVLVLFILTFLVSAPLHTRLANGFELEVWVRLVKTNWLRTGLWFLRAAGLVTVFVVNGGRLW